MSERREHTRYTIWFPVTLAAGSREVWAICRDASQGGILIASCSRVEVGARVQVTFRVAPHEPTERTVEGTVVRMDPRAEVGDPGTPWPHHLAIAFDEPVPELEGQLQRHSSRPPAVGGPT
jgi:hypothetical protein